MPILVVADDLTGAADTGVQFCKAGRRVVLALEAGGIAAAEVLVVCSETRGMAGPDEAGRAVRTWLRQLDGAIPLATFGLFYQKIDSTLRGHPATDLTTAMTMLGMEASPVLVAPAFPAQGRTTHAGCVYVHQTPLAQTVFGGDGDLRKVFGDWAAGIPLETVRQGQAAVQALLEGCSGPILADAESDADLDTLAGAALQAGVRGFCGSAGLAAALARKLEHEPTDPPSQDIWSLPETLPGSVLAVAGSRHAATAAQIEYARERGATVIAPGADFYVSEAGGIAPMVEQLRVALAEGGLCILATSPTATGGEPARIARKLAECAGLALSDGPNWSVRGLILTGGDTARAVCRELGCTGLQLRGEVEAGMALARLQNGRYPGLAVVTKAGGFGQAGALWAAYRAMGPMI